MRFNLLILAAVLLSYSTASHARWATLDDAAVAIDFENREVEIREDGTHTEAIEQQIEILKESARTGYGSRRLHYNSRASTIKVLKAEAINSRIRSGVDLNLIEDKPLASIGEGFDQVNQILIAFPEIGVGSKTYLKYQTSTHEVPLKGFYSNRFTFDTNAVTKKWVLKIRSSLPLFIESNDPQKVLAINQKNEGSYSVITVRLRKPLIESVVDEVKPSLNFAAKTWVVVATSKQHADLALPVVNKYEEIIGARLPRLFDQIASSAKREKSPTDKINVVTSHLGQAVRYMGDWRPISGGHIPRSLETIARTRFGDCKDFATATVALLRKIGIEANVAWVERATQPTPIPKLPLDGAFNHAIVWAKAGEQVFWIDPTNFQSFAQGIFPDIIGRSALLLDKNNPRLEAIPPGTSNGSVSTELVSIDFEKNGDSLLHAVTTFSGRIAVPITGGELIASRESIDYFIATALAKEARIKWKKIGKYSLKTLIVEDLKFTAEIAQKNSSLRTSAGLAYKLPSIELVNTLLDLEVKNRVSDFFVDQPFILNRENILKNVRIIGSQYKGCNIESPWMKAARTIVTVKNGVKINDRFEGLVAQITNQELKSAMFQEFQNNLKNCFDEVAIVFEPVKEVEGRRSLATESKR